MKIILSAQDFGFGPTTQMFAFIKHLLIKGFKGEIYIKRTQSSQLFYDSFIAENEYLNISLIDGYSGDYDKYMSFYDPYLIFEGKKNFKPTIFLCNLTFLWNSQYTNKEISFENIDINSISNHHELVHLAYLLADRVFIRSTDGIDCESLLYSKIKDKTFFIGPIIYPKIFERDKKEFVLVSFGGQVNPLTNLI